MTSKSQSVKVVVRCRPMNKKQIAANTQEVVTVQSTRKMISVRNPHPEKTSLDPVKEFTFDGTYDKNSKQQVIFEQTGLPILQSVIEGYNGTIFAYGQTGTGKTFTMEGNNEKPENLGIVPRIIDRIFKQIEGKSQTKTHVVRASFLELYKQQLIDLLGKPKEVKKLKIHERPNEGIFVQGLTVHVAISKEQLLNKYNSGKQHRTVAQTDMNLQSSRSHCIFSIIVESLEVTQSGRHVRVGKLNLVDLAGSQKQDKTNVTGQMRSQAIKINLSLTTLGKVIMHLVDGKSTHIPYRDSQLTRMLQDSLGGNTKTVMIANVGPSSYNYDQTLATLNYANRAKSIKNDVRINEDPQDALIKKFQNQIKSLKQQLTKGMGAVGGGVKIVQRIVHIEQGQDIQAIQAQFKKDQDKLKKKYEQEKKKIYTQKGLADEQKNSLIKAIQQKEREQQTVKSNQDKLIKKIAKIQQKMVPGNEEQKVAREKQQQLKIKHQQLQQQVENERIKAEQLKQKQKNILQRDRHYTSLKEQADDKQKRIKMLIKKNKIIESENKELEEAYTQEIQQLQDRRRILQKELKLKNLILEYFIPSKELDSLQQKAFWSEERDEWMLPHLNYSGNSLRSSGQYKQPPKQMNQYQQLVRMELDQHPNMYFVYTQEGFARQMDSDPKQKKVKAKKKPSSKSNGRRPKSKINKAVA